MAIDLDLTTYLRRLLADAAERATFLDDPQAHLAANGGTGLDPRELRDALDLLGHDHASTAAFCSLRNAIDSPERIGPMGALAASGASAPTGVGPMGAVAGRQGASPADAGGAPLAESAASASAAPSADPLVATIRPSTAAGHSGATVPVASSSSAGSAPAAASAVAPAAASGPAPAAASVAPAAAAPTMAAAATPPAGPAAPATGPATITTGEAMAVGNVASTAIDQVVATPEHGMQIGAQEATVMNVGVADANTGHNAAASGAPGTVGGPAGVGTGDATAIGNRSDTTISQTASVGIGGMHIGDQEASVFNIGVATADSGHNTAEGGGPSATVTGDAKAIGNVSSTTISQDFGSVGEGGMHIGDQEATVVNHGTATATTGHNTAGGGSGPAGVGTGDASAVGNVSTTDISQTRGTVGHGGLRIGDQEVTVVNHGEATADTGHNTAGGYGEGAAVDSGDASATGNVAGTAIAQADARLSENVRFTDEGGLDIGDQEVTVVNEGSADANTGHNAAFAAPAEAPYEAPYDDDPYGAAEPEPVEPADDGGDLDPDE